MIICFKFSNFMFIVVCRNVIDFCELILYLVTLLYLLFTSRIFF